MDRYDPHSIEARWQRVWDEARAFAVENPDRESREDRSKFYMLDMLP